MLNSAKRDRIFSSIRLSKASNFTLIASSDAIVYISRSVILRSSNSNFTSRKPEREEVRRALAVTLREEKGADDCESDGRRKQMGAVVALFIISTIEENKAPVALFYGCEAAIEEAAVAATSVEKSTARGGRCDVAAMVVEVVQRRIEGCWRDE
ncbi:hypothetical protein BHE74_00006247 [Ensete ventricosum]|nr:hypothetical protein BHE74_00006247 [Ensete ventricosum]